jgi:hypothetical protein
MSPRVPRLLEEFCERISDFAQKPSEPSGGFFAVRKLMAPDSDGWDTWDPLGRYYLQREHIHMSVHLLPLDCLAGFD